MRMPLLVAFSFVLIALPALADATHEIQSKADGYSEGGWMVNIPAGSSDFFNTRYDGSGTTGGIGINVADFGASSSYPRVGVYHANLGLDPSGNSPDLSSILVEGYSPPVLGAPLFTDFLIDLGSAPWSGTIHVAVQFPPGDPGLLGIGADTDTTALGGSELPGSPNPADSSSFTSDGYSTPATGPFTSGDWHLNNQRALDGSSSVFRLNNGTFAGDHVTYTTYPGTNLGTFVSAADNPAGSEAYRMFLSFSGVPASPVGPVLPLPVSDGITSSLRLSGSYPSGVGAITFNLVAITGTIGITGTVAISNEVTVSSPSDCFTTRCTYSFGCYDDGTYETGWVVAIPSGSSDFFNVNHGDASSAGVNAIHGQRIAVMDFGTSVSAYPAGGLTLENTAVDTSGNTPDLSNPYVIQPFSFPALTFCTTSGQLVVSTFATFAPITPNLHGIIQFPMGDSGLLGVGGDTNSTFISGLSGWTLDGYSTPSNLFGANWGMCCDGF